MKEKIFMSDKNTERKLTVQSEMTDFLLYITQHGGTGTWFVRDKNEEI